jgi:glutathione S-transferase
MYTLIGHPRSRALRVIFALEELGLDYEIDPKTPRDPEVMALNGTGKIPLLKTPEGVIGDSVAILTYLADTQGQLTYPAGTYARAVQDSLTQFIVSELDAALWLKAKHSFALPEDWRVPEVKPTAEKEFTRAWEVLAEQKGDKPFLAGDALTIPDILASHCAGWGLTARFPLPSGPMGDWLKSLRKRPAMARAFAQVERFS